MVWLLVSHGFHHLAEGVRTLFLPQIICFATEKLASKHLVLGLKFIISIIVAWNIKNLLNGRFLSEISTQDVK